MQLNKDNNALKAKINFLQRKNPEKIEKNEKQEKQEKIIVKKKVKKISQNANDSGEDYYANLKKS